jgi:hypothetical protein
MNFSDSFTDSLILFFVLVNTGVLCTEGLVEKDNTIELIGLTCTIVFWIEFFFKI